MEVKSSSRSNKKSAHGGPGTAGDRRKAKPKKKKDKRKPSLKGTESTDIPSPELDSEVPLDGDVTLTDQGDGETTPMGQVTKLPHLNTQTSVSLTTQVLPTQARSSTSRKTSCSGQHSSAPTTRSAVSTTALVATASAVDGVVARVASLNIKQRSSKQRGKNQGGKSSNKSSRGGRERSNALQSSGRGQNGASASGSTSTITSKIFLSSQACGAPGVNESLRWELVLDDVEKERERLAVYKMNRRKRYLAAAQAKGLRWAMNYNIQTNVSPFSEDSGVEMACASSGASAFVDFGTMQSLRAIPAAHSRGLQEAFVEC